ncbi:zinc ribbon-containing protein [Thalassotalea sp. ND16A]|uniref:zinc ribbon-containing protein n=1 Tax=Thalassotalea sp. ND16A TaxID=1535422 RepID=UPI00051A2E8E|nr:hypothetical protein [Thalassotalea sp. ND16A]KGJ97181.1 hypothetical protein ND16A_0103 [Thalassotalea sp. ND16A]
MSEKNKEYQSVFDKIYLWLKDAKKSEIQSIQQWVNKADEIITAAEQVSINEYQLSVNSFKQDLLGFYQHNKDDAENSLYLTSISEGMWQHLAKMTDQTQIEWSELVDDFDHDGTYQTGDTIGFGRIQCQGCGRTVDITHASTVVQCPDCGGHEYSRQAFSEG